MNSLQRNWWLDSSLPKVDQAVIESIAAGVQTVEEAESVREINMRMYLTAVNRKERLEKELEGINRTVQMRNALNTVIVARKHELADA